MRVNGGLIRERNVVTISWKAPMHGWVTLNTNGVCKGGILAGYRGIIRGKSNEWICGLSKFLGHLLNLYNRVVGSVERTLISLKLWLHKCEGLYGFSYSRSLF
jgi:hypothetical protein